LDIQIGLLDLKGVGVGPKVTPLALQHSNGLEYLGSAFSDYVMSCLLDQVFHISASNFWTVPTYAVLDLGFDVQEGWSGRAPAGAHVRRAHRRLRRGAELPPAGSDEEAIKLEVEFLLRAYGISTAARGSSLEIARSNGDLIVTYNGEPVHGLSNAEIAYVQALCGSKSNKRIEGINVQLANQFAGARWRAQVVDFGHLNMRSRFQHALASLVCDRPLRIGGVIDIDDSFFVQPDESIAVDAERIDRMALNERCFDLARGFRSASLNRQDVVNQLAKLLEQLVARWSRSQCCSST
jgi:hypothetical protein